MTPAREVSEELLMTMSSMTQEKDGTEGGHATQRKEVPSKTASYDGTNDGSDEKGEKTDDGIVVEERATETPLTPSEATQDLHKPSQQL
jgi:hypothetical protein